MKMIMAMVVAVGCFVGVASADELVTGIVTSVEIHGGPTAADKYIVAVIAGNSYPVVVPYNNCQLFNQYLSLLLTAKTNSIKVGGRAFPGGANTASSTTPAPAPASLQYFSNYTGCWYVWDIMGNTTYLRLLD